MAVYRVIYFYSKTHQMHNIANSFYFGTTLYTFRTISPSIIRSLRLYIQHQVYVIQVILFVQSLTPDDERRDRPNRVVLFQNKFDILYIWLVLL
jgi:hypothetical protein